MTFREQALEGVMSRSERVRARRARVAREFEPAPRERRRKPQRTRRPRRRLDITLAPERAVEVRLPPPPTFRLRDRLTTAVLLAAALWWLGGVLSSTRFHVAEAAVHGNTLLSASQVRSIARVDGKLIFAVNTEEVANRLQALPEVSATAVEIGWPNTVDIHVQERQPVVAWNDAGRTWWLSPDGMGIVERDAALDLVHVETGESFLQISEDALSPVVEPSLLQAAINLKEHLPEDARLQYDRQYGLGYEDPRGYLVYFGAEGDMALKIRIYEAIVAKLEGEGNLVNMVNVADPSAPYFRLVR
jgi:hypothetical protein